MGDAVVENRDGESVSVGAGVERREKLKMRDIEIKKLRE